jgi:hypothetical protein
MYIKEKFLGLIKVAAIVMVVYPSTNFAATVLPGEGVDFKQVDFLFSGVTEMDSDWGRLSANAETLFNSTSISSGYLNVYTDAKWVVQNLSVDMGDGLTQIVKYFTLGLDTPQDVSQLSAYIEFTLEPKYSFTDGPRSLFLVGTAQWNAEGIGESSVTKVGAAPPGNLFIPSGANMKEIIQKKIIQPNAVNKQAAKNQCFPMAIANSLQYLEDRFDLKVPNDHKPGLKGDDTLVGQLDRHADRFVPENEDSKARRQRGEPISFVPMLQGKFSYLKEKKLQNKLVHKHQGGREFGYNGGNITKHGITSKDEGAKVTWEWICNEIKNGEDVELGYLKDGGGGHVVRIFGCGTTKGKRWLRYLHDRLQTNKDPEDKKGLETPDVDVTDLDGDGILNFGSEDREIRFALSESVKKSCVLEFDGEPNKSCYQERYDNETACKDAIGGTLSPGKVIDAAWYPNKTCAQLRKEGTIPEWVELLVTLPDNPLIAIADKGSVKLSLTTATEKKTSALIIYRAKKIADGILEQPQEVCKWDSQGNSQSGFTYVCTDDKVLGTFLYWPVDVNNAGIDTHYIENAVEMTVE